jgi:hypothetical protein
MEVTKVKVDEVPVELFTRAKEEQTVCMKEREREKRERPRCA